MLLKNKLFENEVETVHLWRKSWQDQLATVKTGPLMRELSVKLHVKHQPACLVMKRTMPRKTNSNQRTPMNISYNFLKQFSSGDLPLAELSEK